MCSCYFCGGTKDVEKKIKISDSALVCNSVRLENVCFWCLDNAYENQFGFLFLKDTKGTIYISPPHSYGDLYEVVRSEKQIDRAFNPDRAMFEDWRKGV